MVDFQLQSIHDCFHFIDEVAHFGRQLIFLLQPILRELHPCEVQLLLSHFHEGLLIRVELLLQRINLVPEILDEL